VSDPRDPYNNPPGWTDPYAGDPYQPQSVPPPPSGRPPTTPPGSPLLTGLIVGLLLVAMSVAVFQLFGNDGEPTAGDTTTTTADPDASTTTTEPNGTTTTNPTDTTLPSTDPFDALPPAIPAEDLKMKTDGLRVNDDTIPDIDFGQDAPTAIGRLVASFGDPVDTGWQTSTGQYGVCAGDLERILTFGTLAAIVTKNGGQEVFNGYRNDILNGDITLPPGSITTLSGLALGDTVQELNDTYADLEVSFGSDAKLGSIYEVRSATSGTVLLWGPVGGEDPDDKVTGIYAPDVCGR